jgi:glutamate synthase (NADPH/NADH) small chain
MPARAEEVKHAMEEGIEFHFLAAPVKLEADANSRVCRMQCIQMQLGEPDASGRRRPEPVSGSEFWMDVDTVIVAIGQGCNPIIQRTTPELKVTKRSTIQADERCETSMPGVFAGGDVIRGGSTVLLAMRDGKVAAMAIHEYLMAPELDKKESQVATLPVAGSGLGGRDATKQ